MPDWYPKYLIDLRRVECDLGRPDRSSPPMIVRLVMRSHDYRGGRHYVSYQFGPRDQPPLFSGDDYSPGAFTSIDSDESVRGLLSFMSMRPGDTDDEYFKDYTPEQLAFAERWGEELSMYADDEEAYPFVDLDKENDDPAPDARGEI